MVGSINCCWTSSLHLVDLVSIVFLPEGGLEALVNMLGVEDQSDGEQD